MTPIFGAPQIPMLSRPVQPVNTPSYQQANPASYQQANPASYQQANPSSSGGRVIPIQIESKVCIKHDWFKPVQKWL